MYVVALLETQASISELNSIESTDSLEFVENYLFVLKMKITKNSFLQIL